MHAPRLNGCLHVRAAPHALHTGCGRGGVRRPSVTTRPTACGNLPAAHLALHVRVHLSICPQAFTNDHDLSIGVFSPSTEAGPDTFAGKLRRRIWAEFLLTTPDDPQLQDPFDGIALLSQHADDGLRPLRTGRGETCRCMGCCAGGAGGGMAPCCSVHSSSMGQVPAERRTASATVAQCIPSACQTHRPLLAPRQD